MEGSYGGYVTYLHGHDAGARDSALLGFREWLAARARYLDENSIAVRLSGPRHRRSRYSVLPAARCGTSSLECTSDANSQSTRAKLC